MTTKLSTKHFITINNKKYSYELSPISKETTHVLCEAANIDQEFLNEDIPELLIDLANLILAEKNYEKAQSTVIRFRISVADKKLIEKTAAKKGYASVSSYLKSVSLNRL